MSTFVTASLLNLAQLLGVCVSFLALPFTLFRRTIVRKPTSIFITGASSGIGRSLALSYATNGVFLALTGKNEDRLNEVAEQCRSQGATVLVGAVDVVDADAMKEFIDKADLVSPIDLVIANAGVSGGLIGDKPFEEKIITLFNINVFGVFNTINPLLEKFKERRKGQIAVVASISGYFDFPRATGYSATKAALISYCQGLRQIMKPYGVGVSVICPGYVKTAFTVATHSMKRNTPFLMTSDKAASIIQNGLKNDLPVIAFPFQMFALTFILKSLPPLITEFFFGLLKLNVNELPWNKIG